MKPAARDQDIPRGAGSGAPRATEAPGGDPPTRELRGLPRRSDPLLRSGLPPAGASAGRPVHASPLPTDGPGALRPLPLPPGFGTPRPHALFARFFPSLPRSPARGRAPL